MRLIISTRKRLNEESVNTKERFYEYKKRV